MYLIDRCGVEKQYESVYFSIVGNTGHGPKGPCPGKLRSGPGIFESPDVHVGNIALSRM